MTNRLGVYVDGFNLYHGIDELGQNYLKWVNLRKLSEPIASVFDLQIEKIVYFTAMNSRYANADQKGRHLAYVNALAKVNVQTVKGKFADDNKRRCPDCGVENVYPEEKQSDVNIAIYALEDVFYNRVDHVMIITGDSDQVPTFKAINRIKPSARRIALFPPKRTGNDLKQSSTNTQSISFIDLENALFPNLVSLKDDEYPIRRPDYYSPPDGWLHPSKRPSKKKSP